MTNGIPNSGDEKLFWVIVVWLISVCVPNAWGVLKCVTGIYLHSGKSRFRLDACMGRMAWKIVFSWFSRTTSGRAVFPLHREGTWKPFNKGLFVLTVFAYPIRLLLYTCLTNMIYLLCLYILRRSSIGLHAGKENQNSYYFAKHH